MADMEGFQAELDELTNRLHSEGWSVHVTVARLVANWEELARRVDDYRDGIDDHTNDLTSRDALALALQWASLPLQKILQAEVAVSDEEFRSRTVDDNGLSVGRFYKLTLKDGWWWRRAPSTGPLATYLKESK